MWHVGLLFCKFILIIVIIYVHFVFRTMHSSSLHEYGKSLLLIWHCFFVITIDFILLFHFFQYFDCFQSSFLFWADNLEVHASPVPGHVSPSSTATKVFDFTVVSSESPQAKSCLLSWKGCRDCTYSDDQQSDDGVSDLKFWLPCN